MYIHHITSKEYEKMNNYHERKKDDTMYNIDDYYYASTILNNSTEDGKIYVSINLSGMSYVVVKRNRINGINSYGSRMLKYKKNRVKIIIYLKNKIN